MLGPHPIGQVTHDKGDGTVQEARVWGQLPENVFLAGSEQDLKLVVPSACAGEITIPLKVTRRDTVGGGREFNLDYEKKSRNEDSSTHAPQLEVAVSDAELPKAARFWIDGGGAKSKVGIGKMDDVDAPKWSTVRVYDAARVSHRESGDAGAQELLVYGLECSPEVRLGGVAIGTADPNSNGFFLTTDKAACYRMTNVVYSTKPLDFGSTGTSLN